MVIESCCSNSFGTDSVTQLLVRTDGAAKLDDVIRISGQCYVILNLINYNDTTLPYHPVTFVHYEGQDTYVECLTSSQTTPCPTYTQHILLHRQYRLLLQ